MFYRFCGAFSLYNHYKRLEVLHTPANETRSSVKGHILLAVKLVHSRGLLFAFILMHFTQWVQWTCNITLSYLVTMEKTERHFGDFEMHTESTALCHTEFHSVCHLITLLTWIFTRAFQSKVLELSFQLNRNTTVHLYKTEKDVSRMFSIILRLTYMIMRTLNSLPEFIFVRCLQAWIVQKC